MGSFWRVVGPLYAMLLWGFAMGTLMGYGIWGGE